jgi:hypothetical protein
MHKISAKITVKRMVKEKNRLKVGLMIWSGSLVKRAETSGLVGHAV